MWSLVPLLNSIIENILHRLVKNYVVTGLFDVWQLWRSLLFLKIKLKCEKWGTFSLLVNGVTTIKTAVKNGWTSFLVD